MSNNVPRAAGGARARRSARDSLVARGFVSEMTESTQHIVSGLAGLDQTARTLQEANRRRGVKGLTAEQTKDLLKDADKIIAAGQERQRKALLDVVSKSLPPALPPADPADDVELPTLQEVCRAALELFFGTNEKFMALATDILTRTAQCVRKQLGDLARLVKEAAEELLSGLQNILFGE